MSEALASDLDTNRPSPPRPVSHLVSVEPHPNQPAPPLYQPAPHLDQPTPHLDQPTPNKSWQVTSKAVMEERSLPTCTDDDTVPSPGAASSENVSRCCFYCVILLLLHIMTNPYSLCVLIICSRYDSMNRLSTGYHTQCRNNYSYGTFIPHKGYGPDHFHTYSARDTSASRA